MLHQKNKNGVDDFLKEIGIELPPIDLKTKETEPEVKEEPQSKTTDETD